MQSFLQIASMGPDQRSLHQRQTRALRAVLAECIAQEGFYARRIRKCDLDVEHVRPAEFMGRFPLTTKRELIADQQQHPPYGSTLTLPLERYCRFHQTSGTTGEPLRWPDTAEGWAWMRDNWVRIFESAGVSGGDRVIFPFSFGPFIGFWLAFESAGQMGCLTLPAGGMSSVARLRLMQDNRVNVLCTTPTYALRLAEVAREEGIDLHELQMKRLILAGEPGSSVPQTRARIEQAWGNGVVHDHHGMTEVGPVTYQCPARPGYLHVLEEAYLAEIIDGRTRQPVVPGTTGELILTPLGRIGSPVLRYRTGDMVCAAKEACPCGSPFLTLEGGILGRLDDMVVVRGVNLHPSGLEEVIRSVSHIAEFQGLINQKGSATEIALQIEPSGECALPEELGRQVESRIRDAFNIRIPVEVVPAGTLPRVEMKARRWHRLVAID